MSIFTTQYHFVHGGKKSRFLPSIKIATRLGAAKVRAEGREYRVGLNGSFGTARTWKNALYRTRELLKSKPVGSTVTIHAVTSSGVKDKVIFRKSLQAPTVPNGRGVEGIDRFEAYVKANFPHARFAGDCVCKPLDHGDCAAVDYFDTPENMTKMKNAAIEYADYFHTKYGILFDDFYGADNNFVRQGYNGDYHYHYHQSVYGGIYRDAC